MLNAVIPNFESELETLQHLGPSGFILVINMTYAGPEHFYSAYPLEWQQIYQDEGHTITDPVMHWVMTHSGYTRWSDIRFPDLRQIMKRARQFDINYGAVFSNKVHRKRSLMSIARADRELTDDELELLNAKFLRYTDLMVGQCGLTDKEKEVLRALQGGSGYKEIASDLDISVPTVKARAEKARIKLGAKTTTQAVALATARRYI